MKASIVKGLITLVVAVILVLIIAFPVMWLWNGCLVPAITILKPIIYWQTVGIMTLMALIGAGKSTVNSSTSA